MNVIFCKMYRCPFNGLQLKKKICKSSDIGGHWVDILSIVDVALMEAAEKKNITNHEFFEINKVILFFFWVDAISYRYGDTGCCFALIYFFCLNHVNFWNFPPKPAGAYNFFFYKILSWWFLEWFIAMKLSDKNIWIS